MMDRPRHLEGSFLQPPAELNPTQGLDRVSYSKELGYQTNLFTATFQKSSSFSSSKVAVFNFSFLCGLLSEITPGLMVQKKLGGKFMWPIVEVEVWRKRVNMEDRWGQMEQDMPKYWDDRNIWGEKVLSEGLGRNLSFYCLLKIIWKSILDKFGMRYICVSEHAYHYFRQR